MLTRLLKTSAVVLFGCFAAWVAGFDFNQRGFTSFMVLCTITCLAGFVFIVSGD